MKKYIIIVAGGKGLRMGGDIPKQFIPIGTGRPILMYTIEAFYAYDPEMKIILVLPRDQQPYWKQLCADHQFKIKCAIADGGSTRFHSVKNGLALVPEDTDVIVGVHDGVRPFVAQRVIESCYDFATQFSAVIPVVDIMESVREMSETGNHPANRDNLKIVQTPQVFDVEVLKRAYTQKEDPSFTDDATVVEAMGVSVYLVTGNRENIKLTTPYDLKLAACLQ